MPEMKSKPEMNAPKVRQSNTAPKEAAGILRQQYAEKQAERQPEAKSPVQYATDKVETDGRRGAILAAEGTRRVTQQVKRRKERREKAESTEPKKESAPTAREPEPHNVEQQSQDAPRQLDHAPKQAERAPKQAVHAPKQTAERGRAGQSPVLQERQVAPKTRQSAAATERVGADSANPLSPSPQQRRRWQAVQTAAQNLRDTHLSVATSPHTGGAVENTVTPKMRQNALKGRTEAESNQPIPPSPPELRRQKVVQDTVRTRQEARRGIDAEISRVDRAVGAEQKLILRTEVAGELPSKPAYRVKSGAEAPRTSPHFVGKPGKAEEKAARPRISGVRAPSRPVFTLKERATAGRQLQRNTVTAAQQAKRAMAQKLKRQMVKRNAENAQKATKQAAQLTVKATKAVVGAVKSAVSSIAAIVGGGIVLVVLLVVIALIAAIVASPFGIFFSNESASRDTVPISAAVAQVNFDFNAWLEALQGADTYDDITVEGSTADWAEILAVFATKVAGGDGADAADVATIDADRIDRLKAVFWDMNVLTSEVETIDHPDSDPDDNTDDSWTEKILHITVTPKAAADMPTAYGFTTRQTDAMNELLAERAALMELVGNLTAVSADAAELMKRLPADLSPERREVVRVACSLVGKVTYFWGGKSLVLGWDSRWGTIQKVWADGNSTTGTYRPYGLDCSGFVDWVFFNVSGGAYVLGHGGGATMQHSYCTTISWEDALPGDLVFYPGDEHVGIVGGKDADGNLLIIHCASSANCTVVTGVSGFTSIGRPMYYSD